MQSSEKNVLRQTLRSCVCVCLTVCEWLAENGRCQTSQPNPHFESTCWAKAIWRVSHLPGLILKGSDPVRWPMIHNHTTWHLVLVFYSGCLFFSAQLCVYLSIFLYIWLFPWNKCLFVCLFFYQLKLNRNLNNQKYSTVVFFFFSTTATGNNFFFTCMHFRAKYKLLYNSTILIFVWQKHSFSHGEWTNEACWLE